MEKFEFFTPKGGDEIENIRTDAADQLIERLEEVVRLGDSLTKQDLKELEQMQLELTEIRSINPNVIDAVLHRISALESQIERSTFDKAA